MSGRAALLFVAALAFAVGARLAEAAALPHRRLLGLGLLLGLLGLGARLLPRRAAGAPSRLGPPDAALLALLILLASAVRLSGLRDLPLGLHADEEHAAEAALDMKAGDFAPWRTVAMREGWVEIPAPYYAWPRLLLGLAGTSFATIKAISLVPGILTPALLFLLVRAFAGRLEAACAALMLCGSSWHAGLSRWGWIEVASTLAIAATYAALARRNVALLGALAAVDLYLYEALRAPALAAVLLGLAAARSARERRLLAGIFLCGAAPLVAAYAARPGALIVRAREVSILRDVTSAGSLRPLADSVATYALMLHQTSSPNPRIHPPGEPYMDVAAGALALVGAAGLLASAATRRFELALLAGGLAASALPGVLTRLADAPHGFRTGAVAPFAFALAGLGAGMLPRRWMAIAASLLSLGLGTDLLWRRWPGGAPPEAPLGAGARLLAAETARRAAPRPVDVDDGLRGGTWELLAGAPPSAGADPLFLRDPEALHDVACARTVLHRDRTGRPVLLEGDGCREREAPRGVRVDVWATPERHGAAIRSEMVAHLDDAPCPPGTCALSFRGTLVVDRGGAYELETFSDDGSGLSLDGVLVVDNRGESLGRRRSGAIQLSPGGHPLELTYRFVRGKRMLRTLWRPPGCAWEPIPPEALAP